MIDKIFGNDKPEFEYKFGDKFKFKSLQVYCSTEWMFGATKKYRQVFDKDEVDYIRAEFAFYNKLFDELEWEANVTVKAFQIKGTAKQELCSQDEKIVVTKEQNIVTVHKGWGTEAVGGFWKKGEYVWEAFIDNKQVGSQKFFIEEVGKVTNKNNPYFDVVSLKLYSSHFEGWQENNRKYFKKFNREKTQYIWAEFKLKSKTNLDFNCELFINFYDDAGQLKGHVTSLENIKAGNKDQIFTIQEGWGNKSGGSWKDDKYTCEVIFMDTLVAVVPFEMGNEDVEGVYTPQVNVDFVNPNLLIETEQEKAETLEDVMANLESLIGLQNVKKKIKDHISYLEFLKVRKEKGFDDKERISLHSVFTGNPGTGKTTVVNLLGKIYNKMGLLTKGHVHEVDRADLVGEYIGQTAPKVKKAIDEARGGILFVDEAYMLVRKNEDSKDYGKEVVEVLLKEMSDGTGDIAIMVAGYPEEMATFINSNPGLRSRFNYFFHFDDYMPDELHAIATYATLERGVKITEPAMELIKKQLVEAYRNRDKSFGNARYAYSLIDEAKMNLGLRLMQHPNIKSLSNDVLSTIELVDIEKVLQKTQKEKLDISINENLLRESLQELNSLIGLTNIRKDVNELVKLVRYYRETGKDVLNKFSLHTVFTGNPGTGKTTVARIIAKIYKALGLLERGHVVETDREGLVSGYVGQTAIKTKQRLDESLGGVLFIDEAYALAEKSTDHNFGAEAIEVILKNMEDLRGQFALIVAGYPKNMETFLLTNPGLKSRFDRSFNFMDYSPEELYLISVGMFSKENLKADNEAEAHLKDYFRTLYQQRDMYFGNARSVRKVVEKCIKNQNLRMASMDSSLRTKEMMETVSLEDVQEFIFEQSSRRKIGYNN